MSTDIPEPWASRMVERGYTDRRSGGQGPGMGALSEATGLHISTISEAIRGQRTPKAETVNELVDKLGEDVAGWLGVQYFGRWDPPASASALTRRQRKALEELIVSMTERSQADVPHAASTTAGPNGPDQDNNVIDWHRTGLGQSMKAARKVKRKPSNQE